MTPPVVGPSIAKRMAQYRDSPATSSRYYPPGDGWEYAEAYDRSGRHYVHLRASGLVVVTDPTSWIQAGGGPDPAAAPKIIDNVPGVKAGDFSGTPLGVILHSTRSGQAFGIQQEFDATVNFVRNGADGLGWNLTVGDLVIATHLEPRAWGWNAREHSNKYLAAEFAQARHGGLISDGQVSAFCWWFMHVARAAWPNLPAEFPNHSDLPAGIRDGKSDPEPRGQHSLRDRILVMLRSA